MTTDGDDVLAAPLSSLGLTTRLTNTLLSNGFSTVGDVVAKSELEIWQLHYLGPATLAEIKTKLSALGLALRPGPPLPNEKWQHP
jgi:DNA-directed RNA polymerase alpha subunit